MSPAIQNGKESARVDGNDVSDITKPSIHINVTKKTDRI